MMLSRAGTATLISLLMLAGGIPLNGQKHVPTRADQVMDDRIAFIRQLHDSISSPDRRLVNGASYFPHQKNARNHPFFMNESWNDGTATIRGHRYTGLLMRYDIHLDQPLMLYIESGAKTISMNTAYIDAFTLGDNRFVFMDPRQNAEGRVPGPGFYHVLYDGEPAMFVRWTKSRLRNDGFRPDEFQEDHLVIIKKQDTYFPVRNDRQLRRVLGSHRKETRKFMQQRNIHLSGAFPGDLLRVLEFHESISEQP